MIRAGAVGGAVLAAVLATAAVAAADEQPRELVVTGQGRVEAAPDMATVTAGVESQAEAAAAALSDNGEAMRDVLAALEDAGVARADVQTSHVTLEPVYRQRPDRNAIDDVPEVVGYVARNMVTVRVREVGEVGAVIDAMSEAGINRIGGVAFNLSEPRAHEDEARAQAVRDAREKAELFADAAGVELGRVLSLRETMPFDRPFPMHARAEMAMDGAIAEGRIEVTAMVEMVFALEE
jgi:uncharacterized protein